MIKIDSDVLRNAAGVANNAVSEISSGVDKLNRVTTHDDWNCAERDTINERILAIRKNVETLQSRTGYFLDIIKSAADKFDAADANILRGFNGLHDNLGKSFAIDTPLTVDTSSAVSKEIFVDLSHRDINSYWTNYLPVNNLISPIRICDYSAFDFKKLLGGGSGV